VYESTFIERKVALRVTLSIQRRRGRRRRGRGTLIAEQRNEEEESGFRMDRTSFRFEALPFDTISHTPADVAHEDPEAVGDEIKYCGERTLIALPHRHSFLCSPHTRLQRPGAGACGTEASRSHRVSE